MLFDKLRQHARPLVRAAFLVFSVALGVHFWFYARALLAGTPGVPKPQGVEGFLPVAALVGLKHWLSTGQFDPIHPAGLVILLAVVLLSFLFAKGFCGWLCPIGTGCDGIRQAGRALLGRQAGLPRWLDVGLRGIKYLLLAGFLYGTLVALDARSAAAFLGSPYNIIADLKMLHFVLHPGPVFLSVVGVAAVASFAGVPLWCRHLCPYGALVGLAGLLGPGHLRRDEALCTACGRCSKACPSQLPVAARSLLKSPECHFCGRCVEACPAPGALRMKVLALPLPTWAVGLLCVAVLWGSTLVARAAGHWESTVPREAVAQIARLFGVTF